MSRWTSDPEAAALSLIGGALEDVETGNRVLLAGGASGLTSKLQSPQCAVTRWSRRMAAGAMVQPDPPAGPFTSALLRLPKSRDEQLMTVHQCLGVLADTGRLIVFGGNDEGVRSFQKALADVGAVTTLAARGHGRVLELSRGDVTAAIKPRLQDWRSDGEIDGQLTSYPGLFAKGAQDPGTALLLGHLPVLSDTAAVLDYGAGPGAISAAIRKAFPAADLTLLDNDSIALVAAADNVSGATLVLGESLDATAGRQFDLIVSNPPLHIGFKEDASALTRLIADAPKFLTANGALLMVVQRRIALDRSLAAVFQTVEILADDGRYRVWRAGKGKTATPPPPVSKRRQ